MFQLTQLIAIGTGLLIAQALGMWCKCFLCRSITATLPRLIRLEPDGENGGSQLGTLEVLLFFTSISLHEYTIAATWLIFKVAAKWAAWQHIAQIPREPTTSNDPITQTGDLYLGLRDRFQLSNYLLATFMNGTLYNIVAAGTGALITHAMSTVWTYRLFFLSESTLWAWLLSVWAINIILTFSLLAWGRPRFCDC